MRRPDLKKVRRAASGVATRLPRLSITPKRVFVGVAVVAGAAGVIGGVLAMRKLRGLVADLEKVEGRIVDVKDDEKGECATILLEDGTQLYVSRSQRQEALALKRSGKLARCVITQFKLGDERVLSVILKD